ncbi:MAG: YIP1 family protein, partial [Desulfobacteraceae bacterium]|nr:YIP1 family protein [Desulfobacteraceae bacterium]
TFKGGIGEPLAFGLLIGSIGGMFSFFWQFLMLSGGLFYILQSIFGQVAMGLFFFIVIVIVPIFVTLALFLYSSILHILLLIVRGGKNGYEATFRVVSYSQAAQVWSLIPFIGSFIGGIWQLIIQMIGLRVIHQTSYLRVILAFLIPVAFIFLLVIGALIFLFIHIT